MSPGRSGRRTPFRGVIAVTLGLVGTALQLGCASAPTSAEKTAAAEAEFKERLDRLGKSLEAGDLDQLESLYAPNSVSQTFNTPSPFASSGEGSHQDKVSEALKRTQDLKVSFPGTPQLFQEASSPNRIWTLVAFDVSATLKDGSKFHTAGKHSALWVKGPDEKWKIVYENILGEPERTSTPTSVPTPPPPPPPIEMPPPAPEPAKLEGFLKDVFFDYDKSEIKAEAKAALSANAEWLLKNPGAEITIEGHCDERGTREYNIALGERRAGAVKNAMVALGVKGSRIRTVSYGKERPFAVGNDEEAYSKNRRGHFLVTKR